MKKSLFQLLFALLVSVAGVWLYMYEGYLWQPFELKLKDVMLQLRGEIKGDPRIVIIDIDEQSLQKLGQWPWSRDKVATILENLSSYGVGIVGLDVVFAEADNSSPKLVLEKLGRFEENVADFDAILANTIEQTPTIIGYVFAMEKDNIPKANNPKNSSISVEYNKPENSLLLKPYRAILNIPILEKSAYSSGYFNTIPDKDGIVRSIPLVMEYDGAIYPSLSLEMIRLIREADKIEISYDDRGVSGIGLGDLFIPTDFNARLNVNYRGGKGSFRYISALDVFEKKLEPNELEGTIALLGTSAAGLLDLRSTPFDNAYPGVEVHANAIDNMLNGNFYSKPIWSVGTDMAIIVVGCLVTFVALLLPSAIFSILVLFLLNALFIGIGYIGMVYFGILFYVFIPLIGTNAVFLVGQAMNYFLEIKQKEMIKGKFASKVSPAVMHDILESGDIMSVKEREISVFFSDLRNFTNISEAMGNPKNLIRFMNRYMDPMTEIIIKTEGTVDKFIGDAIMAYWNAPVDVSNHADKAVGAALMQLHHLKKLNEELRNEAEFINAVKMADKKGIPIVDIGIGINTGIAIVGEMGTTKRSDYTVIGDAINLGARLESLCKYYNSKLNISHFTKAQLKGDYIFRFLDLVTVKGKTEPVEIWQIHDFKDSKEPLYGVEKGILEDELEIYHKAIELYKKSQFAEALEIFQTLEKRENRTNIAIYGIYIDRCAHYIANPPTSFNGVFEHSTKG